MACLVLRDLLLSPSYDLSFLCIFLWFGVCDHTSFRFLLRITFVGWPVHCLSTSPSFSHSLSPNPIRLEYALSVVSFPSLNLPPSTSSIWVGKFSESCSWRRRRGRRLPLVHTEHSFNPAQRKVPSRSRPLGIPAALYVIRRMGHGYTCGLTRVIGPAQLGCTRCCKWGLQHGDPPIAHRYGSGYLQHDSGKRAHHRCTRLCRGHRV